MEQCESNVSGVTKYRVIGLVGPSAQIASYWLNPRIRLVGRDRL